MALLQSIKSELYQSDSVELQIFSNLARANSHISTLFHYTKTVDALLSILKEGLRVTYCLEEYPIWPVGKKIGVPMISFCDIPIRDSIEHVQKYGPYAIGLTKDSLLENELIRNLISPVHYYISPNPIKPAFQELEEIRRLQKKLSEDFTLADKEQIKAMEMGDYTRVDGISNETVLEGRRCEKHIQQNLEATCYAIGLLKPHTSYVLRKDKEKYVRQINYDECEWRIIVPEIWDMDKGTEQGWLWTEKEYEAWRGDGVKPFIEDKGVTFSVDCISFVIVETEQEIPSFIQKLDELEVLCGEPLTVEQKKLLFSKVISFERIRRDF